MSRKSRSTAGCWTCKLRKKKCDEMKPTCSVCSALKLECSGYGPHPEWMDSGVREKEMAARIRETVKKSNSERKRAAMKLKQGPKESPQGADSGGGQNVGGGEGDEQFSSIDNELFVAPRPFRPRQLRSSVSSPEDPSKQQEILSNFDRTTFPLLIDGSPPGPSPQRSAEYIAHNESILLMHYLDDVFLRQFRFYQPSVLDGGRGWLLSLLMQTKPLYYAACSLAAYHRQMIYCLKGGMMKPCLTKEALHLQYDVAVTELRRYLATTCDRERNLMENIQLFCSIILLISTEAFISSPSSWKMHLTAATAIFPTIQTQLQNKISEDQVSHNLRAALSFFASVGLWYDIISYSTTGSKPYDDDCHAIEGTIHFEKVMGCANWVMFDIKNIATLDHWKREQKAGGQLSVRELVERGNEIEARLKKGIEDLHTATHSSDSSSSERNCISGYDQKYINTCVTKIYSYAALVNLHVTISGPSPSLPEISHSVALAIQAFKALPHDNLDINNSLIWPLVITGCMAREQDEDIFRELAMSDEVGDETFGASKARIVLEECWRLRRAEGGSGMVDWRTAMESLELRILLV